MDRILEVLKDCNFYWGAGCGALLLFLLWCIIVLVRKCRGTCTELVIEEQGGRLVITTKAIQSFLMSALSAFPGIETLAAKIKSRLGKKTMILIVKVKPEGDMAMIRNELRQFVVDQFTNRLNILDTISDVDIVISQLPSSDMLKATQPHSLPAREPEPATAPSAPAGDGDSQDQSVL